MNKNSYVISPGKYHTPVYISLPAGSSMWKVEDSGITSPEVSLVESTVYRLIEYPTRPMLFSHDLLKNHTSKRAVMICPPRWWWIITLIILEVRLVLNHREVPSYKEATNKCLGEVADTAEKSRGMGRQL